MAKKQKNKKSATVRGFFTKIALAIFLVYALVSFVQIRVQINDKKEQVIVLEQKIAEQEAKNAELKELKENGIDDDYKANFAREHGYAMQDEKVYENIKNS